MRTLGKWALNLRGIYAALCILFQRGLPRLQDGLELVQPASCTSCAFRTTRTCALSGKLIASKGRLL